MRLLILLKTLLLSAASLSTIEAWPATKNLSPSVVSISSAKTGPATDSLLKQSCTMGSNDLPSTRGGAQAKIRLFHWAQVWGVAFNAFGLFPPLKTGFGVLLCLVQDRAMLATKERVIGAILLAVSASSTGRFAFSIAPKMVNRTIDRVGPDSSWHRKALAPLATIGLLPLTYQAVKMTAILVPAVAGYLYLVSHIPQPYQDIYKVGVYSLQLAPMGVFMLVGIARHWLESNDKAANESVEADESVEQEASIQQHPLE